MGMDVYGLNPVMRSPQPVLNWDNSSEEEKNEYIHLKNQHEDENPGVYFRANIWAWRPIAVMITELNETFALGFPEEFISRLHENSGAGLKTQEECNKLANFLEGFIDAEFKDWVNIGLNTGFYSKTVVDEKGNMHSVFLKDEECVKVSTFLGDDKIFVKDNIIDMDGYLYKTSHTVSVDWVRRFIAFLRECGGFEIN